VDGSGAFAAGTTSSKLMLSKPTSWVLNAKSILTLCAVRLGLNELWVELPRIVTGLIKNGDPVLGVTRIVWPARSVFGQPPASKLLIRTLNPGRPLVRSVRS